MGPYRGAQAELLRVPYADANCIAVPGEPGDNLEDALVLLADAFVTGWHATELGRVYPGSAAAVFGAGTIGLLSAYSCLLRGADVVYVVDYVTERLGMAARLGAVPVDFRMGGPGGPDPRAAPVPRAADRRGADERGGHRHRRGGLPGPGPRRGIPGAPGPREPGPGDRGPGPAGQPHRARRHHRRVRGKGPAPGARGHADGHLTVPWATFFGKGVSVGFGRTHDRRYTVLLRDMILSGRARPAAIVTHHGRLDDAPALYQAFDQRADGVIKAVLHP
jgi:glutathione-independent formaldehyde dehydrogenase